MDEEKILLQVDSDINKDTKTEEFVEVIDVVVPEPTEIDMVETIGGGFIDGVVTHNSLPGRNIPDQHEVSAITGLGDMLTKLGAIRSIEYSSNGGFAEFQQWVYQEDIKDYGYFVSLQANENPAATTQYVGVGRCNNEHPDVYGVTVKKSGFCGAQDNGYYVLNPDTALEAPNHNAKTSYVQVCLVGCVPVRYDSKKESMAIGDYVLPNSEGLATKSENGVGFRVISVNTDTSYTVDENEPSDMPNFVVIALVPQNDNVARVVEKLKGVQGDIGDIYLDIDGINKDLYNIKVNVGTQSDIIDKLIGDNGIINTMQKDVSDAYKKASQAEINAGLAAERAQEMKTNASKNATEAKELANSVLGDLNYMRDNLYKLVSYTDENGEPTTFADLVKKADEQEVELSDLLVKVGDDNNGMIAQIKKIDENGARIQNLVAHSDRYSIGDKSVGYGLSIDEINGFLGDVEHYYICTKAHIERSYIYKCGSVDAVKDEMCYIEVDNAKKYSFKAPYNLTNRNIIYNSKTRSIIIDQGTKEERRIIVEEIKDTTGLKRVSCDSEYTTFFSSYEDNAYAKYYVWQQNDGWVEGDYFSTNTESVPIAMHDDNSENGERKIKEGDLWYLNNSEYLTDYEMRTLYRYDGSQWVSVATLDGNARSIGLVQQTADSLSSQYTDLDGNVSQIKQTVGEISTVVMNVDGQGSTIQQVADKIIMGTFDPEDSTSLALLLNGISGISSTATPICTSVQDGSIPDGVSLYSEPPHWDEENRCYVFDENSNVEVNGKEPKYYFNSEYGNTRYCEIVGVDKFKVYTLDSSALASFNSLTTDERSAIESWTKFRKGADETMSLISQESTADGAGIASAVFGTYVDMVELSDDIPDLSGIKRYSVPPRYISDAKIFKFRTFITDPNGNGCMNENPNGDYWMNKDDDQHYYKLVKDKDGIIVGYEKYGIKQSKYASIMQQIDSDGSVVGLVANNNNVEGSIFVESINDSSKVLINADKIGINGEAIFRDNLNNKTTTISGDYIRTGILQSNIYNGPVVHQKYGVKIKSNTYTECYLDDKDCAHTLQKTPFEVTGYTEYDLQIPDGMYYCRGEDGNIYDVECEIQDYTDDTGTKYYFLHSDTTLKEGQKLYYKKAEKSITDYMIIDGEPNDCIWYTTISLGKHYKLLQGSNFYNGNRLTINTVEPYTLQSGQVTTIPVGEQDIKYYITFGKTPNVSIPIKIYTATDDDGINAMITKNGNTYVLELSEQQYHDVKCIGLYDDGQSNTVEVTTIKSEITLLPSFSLSPATIEGYLINEAAFDIQPDGSGFNGIRFDLDNGTIHSGNFVLDKDGNVSISGKITATSGYIGTKKDGFEIGQHPSKILDIPVTSSIVHMFIAGKYAFKYQGQYYVFDLDEKSEGVYYNTETNKMYVFHTYYDDILDQTFTDSAPEPYNGKKYVYPPKSWDGKTFVFDEDDNDDNYGQAGTYYFHSEDTSCYCRATNDGYSVYKINKDQTYADYLRWSFEVSDELPEKTPLLAYNTRSGYIQSKGYGIYYHNHNPDIAFVSEPGIYIGPDAIGFGKIGSFIDSCGRFYISHDKQCKYSYTVPDGNGSNVRRTGILNTRTQISNCHDGIILKYLYKDPYKDPDLNIKVSGENAIQIDSDSVRILSQGKLYTFTASGLQSSTQY